MLAKESTIIQLDSYREKLQGEIEDVDNSSKKIETRISNLKKIISDAYEEISFLEDNQKISERQKEKNKKALEVLDGIKRTGMLTKDDFQNEDKEFYFFLSSRSGIKNLMQKKKVLSFQDFLDCLFEFNRHPALTMLKFLKNRLRLQF